jgi:hypothetical protein
LDIGVPGAGFDRRQAVRAWEIAVRLREQAARFRLQCDIPDAFPESKVGLEALEAGIQLTAKRLAMTANICASSLEGLVDALERHNTGVQILAFGRFRMRNKASHRRRLFGRRQRRLVEAAERPQQEEEIPNPMRPEGWARWLELQRELELPKIQDS